MWKAATTTFPQTWEKEMQEIKKLNVEAFKHLINPPRYWSRPRFKTNPKCDALVNNMSEAFNSVIVEARGKSIITMLEEIRVYMMEKWAANRNKIAQFEGDILPRIQKKLDKESHHSRNRLPSWSGEHLFEVRSISGCGEKFSVNLQAYECSCRKWMLTRIPCCHAISCMNYMNLDPKEYIPQYFRKAAYELVYAPLIYL
ncbi:hypothetical protein Fmac_013283 [Flemingia macrophylla]|uniref:SWIM-type domain-containing protein n=1 Tax=Flemingia macrophylla TaxID=520843 RepID=A0ABD1MTJ8_9FABA